MPLAATLAIFLSVHAFLGRWWAREELSQFIAADLERSTSLIKGAMHDGMLLNRKTELQARIERLGSSPGFTGIRVYSKEGRVALSADHAERGQTRSIRDDACVVCHVKGVESGPGVRSVATIMTDRDGHRAPRAFTVIRNETGCSSFGCHQTPSEQPVLGVLDVEMTMAPFDEAIARTSWQLGWTTLLLILISGLIVALLARRLVLEPVARLREGTHRIASGDLTTRIDVSGGRELASLASSFNMMVSDLQDAQDELARWSRTLEQRVDEKTRALQVAHQQLSQVQTMASLGKLSATVAHEINNPLSGILAYARLVRRELAQQPVDPAVREELESYLVLIDKECVRCGDIVKNLLTFARQRSVRPGPTDVNRIVEDSLMLVRHHLEMHQISVQTTLLKGDPIITAVSGQIQQTVLALLMNAIEAMQANAGRPARLEVRLEGDEDRVTLQVRDTGVGIAPDLIPHIFEPFVTTKGDAKGVGLGLSVVYGVVHGHGGDISVASSVGEGTTFTVRLPRQRDDAQEDPSSAQRAEAAS